MKNKIDIDALISLIKNFDYSMLTDAEWDELKTVDVLNHAQALQAINTFIVPMYESLDPKSKKTIKDNLSSALALSDYNFDRILEYVTMPFDPFPDNREFFLLIWQAIFKSDFA